MSESNETLPSIDVADVEWLAEPPEPEIKLRKLEPYREDILARMAVSGAAPHVIGQALGCSANRVRKLVEHSPTVQQKIADYLVEIDLAAANSLAYFRVHSRSIAENIVSMALDKGHKACSANAHYVLDRVLPHIHQHEITVKVPEGTMQEFAEAVDQLASAGGLTPVIDVTDLSKDKHLRSGAEVMRERDNAGLAAATAGSQRPIAAKDHVGSPEE